MSQEHLSPELLISIIKEKHAQLIPILEEVDIDCWMIFVRETESAPDPAMELAVGGDVVGESAFIFSVNEGILTKTAIVKYFDENATKGKGLWDEVIGYTTKLADPLQNLMKKLNPKKIALNYSKNDVSADGLSYGMWLILQEILANYADRFCSSTQIINALQGKKTPREVELITKACELTEVINRSMATKFAGGHVRI